MVENAGTFLLWYDTARGRGLKQDHSWSRLFLQIVVARARAWIETLNRAED